MRKSIGILVAVSLVIGIVSLMLVGGLGGPGERVESKSDSSQQTSSPEEQKKSVRDQIREKLQLTSGILEGRTLDLPEMIRAKQVRVLTTYTYGNYFVHEGATYGYEYSLMEEFREFLNRSSRDGLKVSFFYIPLPYDLLIPALNQGYGDIVAANMTINPERSQHVDFTDPYQWNIKEVLVSNSQVEDLEKPEDLAERQVYVRDGSSYQFSLQKLNRRLAENGLSPIEVITLPGLINTGEIIEMVSAGIIDMTVADSHIAAIASDLLPDLKVQDHIVLDDDVKFGWMVRKNNPQLKASLNRFLKTIKKGTLKGNIYLKRYFEENPWVREALEREDLNKFSEYAPLFEKYGETYGIDWVLLAAQAYQESGLDPNAVSGPGAIGLFQLLPSTARDMGIENIDDPENNIRAGAKYLRWVMDHYFAGPEFSEDDRVRFALAAYNAGPANIQKSRKAAASMGYDSTKWFGNCELGAMKQVGFEPVHYIRNINKYYLAFLISNVVQEMKQETFRELSNQE